ncbi:beta-galactosidase, partial [bacterium]|nr:beta-galactosidase [bacterium]
MARKLWILTVLIALLVLGLRCTSEKWQPTNLALSTPWTADVTPENAWPEYPRPQLVREQWRNLNGLWDYAILPRETVRPQAWSGKILVPYPVE